MNLEEREGPRTDAFDRAADAIETATDPVSHVALNLANPIGAVLRAVVPLPVNIQTHPFMGIHVEWCIPAVVPPIPVPCVSLLGGIVTPSVVGIAIDLALYATGVCPVPVHGVFVGFFKALKAGEQPFGVHLPMSPQGVPCVLPGEPEFVFGSDSVDIKSRHAIRFMEQGMGCNRFASPAGPSVPLPNTVMLGLLQFTFPVVAGGASVLDTQAVGDRVVEELAKLLVGRTITDIVKNLAKRAVRGDLAARLVADFVNAFAQNLVRDAADGRVTFESVVGDAAGALQKAILKQSGRGMSVGHERTRDHVLDHGIDLWAEQGGALR